MFTNAMANNQQNQKPLKDADLITRCLAGDKTAFASLIDRHRIRLERLLRVILNDWREVEDIWQETLLRAYLNLEQLRDRERFGAWLCSIAINLARTQRGAVFPGVLSWEMLLAQGADATDRPVYKQSSPEAVIVEGEMVNRVRRAIADLPPAEREAVMLVYLGELSHKEAASQLGSSLSAIKVRVHRGRRRLRKALQTEFEFIISKKQSKEREMIQANVHDVMICIKPEHIPSEDEEVNLIKLFGAYRAILLKEQSGERALAIWIGPFEADSIVIQLRQKETKRPLTYELIKTLLDIGNMAIERIVISRLHEDTFYGNLMVNSDSTVSEVDCRPSDGINLALRLGVPIFVDSELMEQHSFGPDLDGTYSWTNFEKIRAQQSSEQSKEGPAEQQNWIWLSALGLDDNRLAEGYITIGDRELRLDAESKEIYAKMVGRLK